MSAYWGNRQWYWYHIMSYTSPEVIDLKNKKFYVELLFLMTTLLPCQKCYNHFTSYLKKTPVDFNNRETMIKWFITAHNHVNKLLNKPIISLEESNNLYLKNGKENGMENTNLESNKNGSLENETNQERKKWNLKDLHHSYLNEYIKYHSDRGIFGHEPLHYVVKMIERLIVIYPCLKCREVILEYNQRNPIRIYGKTLPTFRKWYNNFFNHQNLSNHFDKKWKNMS